MSFEKDKYEVIRKAISKELASFCYAYFLNKRQVAKHLQDTRYISPFDESWGTWTDTQIPDTYSHYADLVMETLSIRVRPKMMAITKMNLVPTYTYARIYKYGDVLHRHKDRPSCEISCTLNLGGDEWPIYLDPTEGNGNKGKKSFLKVAICLSTAVVIWSIGEMNLKDRIAVKLFYTIIISKGSSWNRMLLMVDLC